MKKLFYFLVITIMSIANNVSYAQNAHDYIVPYGTLLSKYVSDGEKDGIRTVLLDYISWRKNPLHLKSIHELQAINPDTLYGKEKMAFWINAYNLLTIDLIIKTGEEKTIKNQGGFFKNVWKSHNWKIHGNSYTLDEIENKILRPMGEPRIHMAINCASLSCPNLRATPYDAEKLSSQLEEQAKLFIQNQSKGVKKISSGIKISKIFDWFSEDFGGEKGVMDFIRKYSSKDINATEIKDYFDYNWNLNDK